MADGLQERGLVERTADPADRRAVCSRATDGRPAGAARRSTTPARADSAELFARLCAADRAELARILRSLTD